MSIGTTTTPRRLKNPSEIVRIPKLAGARRRIPPVTTLLAIIWLVLLSAVAVFAPQIAPHDPIRQDLMQRNLPPIWEAGGSLDFVFGTDASGRDLLSRTMYGARPALTIGSVAVFISLLLGTSLGLVSGYFRGRIDSVIMLLADAQLSMPFLVIALSVVAVLGQSVLILVLLAGMSSWMGFARAIRSDVLSQSARDYVTVSRALGAGDWHILRHHLLPNILPIVLVLTTNSVAGLILFESSMGFLGMGVPPPSPSWGSMISDGRDYLLSAWWLCVVPGVALMLTVVSTSLIGDWLRDRLDPTVGG